MLSINSEGVASLSNILGLVGGLLGLLGLGLGRPKLDLASSACDSRDITLTAADDPAD